MNFNKILQKFSKNAKKMLDFFLKISYNFVCVTAEMCEVADTPG